MGHLRITLQDRHGSVLRALGLIQRRGFSIEEIVSSRRSGAVQLQLDLKAESASADNLVSRLNQSVDVVNASYTQLVNDSHVQVVGV